MQYLGLAWFVLEVVENPSPPDESLLVLGPGGLGPPPGYIAVFFEHVEQQGVVQCALLVTSVAWSILYCFLRALFGDMNALEPWGSDIGKILIFWPLQVVPAELQTPMVGWVVHCTVCLSLHRGVGAVLPKHHSKYRHCGAPPVEFIFSGCGQANKISMPVARAHLTVPVSKFKRSPSEAPPQPRNAHRTQARFYS